MKTICCIVAAAGFLISAPVMAGQYGNGGNPPNGHGNPPGGHGGGNHPGGAPVQQTQTGSGTGATSLWSNAQGTSSSIGPATAFGVSTSGAASNTNAAGGSRGFVGGAGTSAFTTSSAGTTSNGTGSAQAQTSGAAGGVAAGIATRTR